MYTCTRKEEFKMNKTSSRNIQYNSRANDSNNISLLDPDLELNLHAKKTNNNNKKQKRKTFDLIILALDLMSGLIFSFLSPSSADCVKTSTKLLCNH